MYTYTVNLQGCPAKYLTCITFFSSSFSRSLSLPSYIRVTTADFQPLESMFAELPGLSRSSPDMDLDSWSWLFSCSFWTSRFRISILSFSLDSISFNSRHRHFLWHILLVYMNMQVLDTSYQCFKILGNVTQTF